MIGNPKVLWNECLKLIRQNVSESQYKAWFATIVFDSFSQKDKTLLLRLPSAFAYEYLEQNYVDLLKKVLTHYFGEDIVLRYRILTDKTNNLSQEVESDQPAIIDEPKKLNNVNKTPTALDAAVPQQIDSQLNPHQTFNNFIEGDSNKMPRSIGYSIAEHPNKNTFNPLFLYGPSGCGKTHLVNAIGVKIKEMYPEKRVLYVSARLFQVQYTNAVLQNTTNDFIIFYHAM